MTGRLAGFSALIATWDTASDVMLNAHAEKNTMEVRVKARVRKDLEIFQTPLLIVLIALKVKRKRRKRENSAEAATIYLGHT